jgi:hypothetical protein
MTLKYCKCGAVVNESYSEFINFEKWTCDCEITNAKNKKDFLLPWKKLYMTITLKLK